MIRSHTHTLKLTNIYKINKTENRRYNENIVNKNIRKKKMNFIF